MYNNVIYIYITGRAAEGVAQWLSACYCATGKDINP